MMKAFTVVKFFRSNRLLINPVIFSNKFNFHKYFVLRNFSLMESLDKNQIQKANEETSRKLASVQIVEDIKPHLNSNHLALATVLGWQVVIKKEEVKVGDKIVYFEIDSILPEKEWSNFLKVKKFKIKTIKLCGEISQGLIMPLKILSDNGEVNPDDFTPGQDLTNLIGVKKHQTETELTSEQIACSFPLEHIEKSDEPRIQSEPQILIGFKGKPYYATLKYDGTSSTYLVDPNNKEEFYVCSRNLRRQYIKKSDEIYSFIADKYKIREKLLAEDCRYAIQGEIYGPKVAKNLLGVKNQTMAVFNARDLKEKRYLDCEELEALCKKLDLPMVEIIEKGEDFNYSLNELKEKSKGNYPNTKNPREGLVFRLTQNWYSEKRNSFKIINDDFLVKHDAK
jgi:RNA ligase (TIGR02306 family)